MRIGNSFFAALVVGVVWSAIYMVLTSILAMLISGKVFLPNVGPAVLAGLVAMAFFILVDPAKRNRTMLAATASLLVFSLLVFSGLKPFGVPVAEGTFVQVLTLIGFGALNVISWGKCLKGMNSGNQRRYQLEIILIRTIKGFGFVFFTIIVALPFYVMLMTSLKSQQALLANPLDLSIDLGQGAQALFRSYVELFTEFNFGTFLFNSAIVSVTTVIITLMFSVPGAYAVARLKFPGQAFLSRSILLIYMVPAIVLVIPLYAVFSKLGLRNSLVGLLLVYPATTIPVAVYMLQGYFRGLPGELEEAGLMDGLTRLGVIWKITLPLSVPALASVSLYIFMIAWNEFLFAFMFLDDPSIFTLSRGVESLNSSEVPRQHLMAGAVVATVPVLAIFLWFEKFLVAGLTAGSVKG